MLRSLLRVVAPTLACATLALLVGCSGNAGSTLAPPPVPAAPQGNGSSLPGSPALSPALTSQHMSNQPRTWYVVVGAEAGQGAFQALDFFTRNITIDAGDSVTWKVEDGPTAAKSEPHTVSFLAPGQSPPSPSSPQAVQPAGGHIEDGTQFVSSGILFSGQTYTLTFPKPGVYPYHCLFHYPEMAGVVTVNPAGTAYPKTQGQYDSEGAIDRRQDLRFAKRSVHEFPYREGGTTLVAGISPGLVGAHPPRDETVLRFLDSDVDRDDPGGIREAAEITIPVGTTLTWVNQTSNEVHTVTFPPAGQGDPGIDPFSPPIGGPTYDGSSLTNSGPLFPGQHYSLTFTARGTFNYYCEFHDNVGMMGTVTVK
jgi:plastocyanin